MSQAEDLLHCNVLDCGPPAEAEAIAPIPRRRQPVDYMAKDYDSFLRGMLDLLPTRVPEWKDRTEADLGMALLELFAYFGDELSYYQDRVAEEGFLRTASQYESVRKLLRLVDYRMDPGAAARVILALDANAAKFLPAGLQVQAPRLEGEAVVYEIDETLTLLAELGPMPLAAAVSPADIQVQLAVAVFVAPPVGARLRLESESGSEWVDVTAPAVIAAGTTTIGVTPVVGNYPVVGGKARLIGLSADAQRGDADLMLVGEWDEGLLPTGSRLLVGSGDGAEWVRISEPRAVDTVAHTTSVALTLPIAGSHTALAAAVRGNGALASHGTRHSREAAGTGAPSQEISLLFAPLTYVDDSSGTPRSSLSIETGGDAWQEVEDFVASEPPDRHFITRRDNEGFLTIEFGDGAHGREPELRASIDLRYRSGVGEMGVVAAGSLTEPIDELPQEVTAVTNPLRSFGAREPESIADARLLGPRQIRRQNRAVVPEDYTSVLKEGVLVGSDLVVPLHATARFEWTGSWTTAVVSVEMPDRKPLADEVNRAFDTALAAKKLAGYDVRVEGPRYAPLRISLIVHVESEFFARQVRVAVEKTLGNRVSSDGAVGFFAPERFDFGEDVYMSDLYAAVMALEGVEFLQVTRFKRLGNRYPDREAEGSIAIAPLEIARCDNDPTNPLNGVLYVRTCGGKEG